MCYGLDIWYVSYIEIVKKVIFGLYDGVIIIELDNLVVEIVVMMVIMYLDYVLLVVCILILNLYKNIDKFFFKIVKVLFNYIDFKMGEKVGLIGEDIYKLVWKNRD